MNEVIYTDFFFFSNQYFARKLRSKGLAQEDYDWKMIEPKITQKHDSRVYL